MDEAQWIQNKTAEFFYFLTEREGLTLGEVRDRSALCRIRAGEAGLTVGPLRLRRSLINGSELMFYRLVVRG